MAVPACGDDKLPAAPGNGKAGAAQIKSLAHLQPAHHLAAQLQRAHIPGFVPGGSTDPAFGGIIGGKAQFFQRGAYLLGAVLNGHFVPIGKLIPCGIHAA